MKKTSTDKQPDRDKLGPTGPAKVESPSRSDFDKSHPNAGNISKDAEPRVGPTPTDAPQGNAGMLKSEIDKQRGKKGVD
jgi:hypothetical protein